MPGSHFQPTVLIARLGQSKASNPDKFIPTNWTGRTCLLGEPPPPSANLTNYLQRTDTCTSTLSTFWNHPFDGPTSALSTVSPIVLWLAACSRALIWATDAGLVPACVPWIAHHRSFLFPQPTHPRPTTVAPYRLGLSVIDLEDDGEGVHSASVALFHPLLA